MFRNNLHKINEWPVERLGLREFNFKLIARITGTLLVYFACSMALPLLVSLYYKDGAQFSFLVSGMVILLLGMLLRNIVGRNARYDLKEIESYWITFIIWMVVPLCGTVPYLVTGAIGTLTDAVFESFSGFTTTGSSIVALPEELPVSLLTYRSFTQWVGGIGLLLFVVAILRKLGIGAGQLYEAEFSGARHRKLHPRLSVSVTRMWTLYTLITLSMAGLLYWVGKVRFSDAICLALSTVSTGGFAPDNGGMAMLNDNGLLIVTVFMMLSGISLVRLYQLFTFRWVHLKRDQELHCYLVILFTSVILCAVSFGSVGNGWMESVQYSLFHVASTMSSTGFYVEKPDHWSFFVSAITFLLIILGASAGSTGGGIKIWRVIALVKYIRNYFTKMLHPNAVTCVKINGRVVETEYVNKIFAYVFLYMAFIVGGAFVLTLCGCTIPSSICMAAANVSNLGPSPLINNLGGSLDYVMLPKLAKWTLTVLMLAGRLELFALIAILSPAYWKRRI